MVKDGHNYSFWDIHVPLATCKWDDDYDSGCSLSAGDNPTETDEAGERYVEESVADGSGGGDEHTTTGAYQV